MADIKNFTPKVGRVHAAQEHPLVLTYVLTYLLTYHHQMQADDEQRVKHVIDLYAPYLEGAVAHLLTGRSSIN